jgi:peptidoglycan/LPS O-acetylase OafA/YrhL
MAQQPEIPMSFESVIVDGPVIWVLLVSVAIGVATLLVRHVPPIRRSLHSIEAGRQASIDGLRGLLGIAVFSHHTVITWFYLHGAPWQLPPSRLVAHLGQTSVALFFMITAFLFWGRVLARGDQIDWVDFIVSRMYRLYPAYLLMLGLVVTAVFIRTAGTSVPDGPWLKPLARWLVFTMFGAPDLNGVPETSLMVAGVTWSLRYEWLFYLALPLLGFATRRSRQPIPAVFSAAALATIFWALGGFASFVPAISQSFLGGIVAAHWVRNPVLVSVSRTRGAALVAVAALAGVVAVFPTAYMWPATAGLTIFFVAVSTGQDLWGLLRLPGLLWLGDITYSIYLLHGFLLWLIFQGFAVTGQNPRWAWFLLVALLVDVVLVLLSSLVFLLIERPVILMGRRHRRRHAPAAAEPSGR